MAATRKSTATKANQSSGSARKAAEKKAINSKKNESENMFVQDKLATIGPRTHELMDSKGKLHIYTFKTHSAQLAIPSDVVTASRLIQNDGFIVRKEKDGIELRPRMQTEEQAVLQADECVAHYDELTSKALLRRCLERGAEYNTRTNRDAMVTFLMGATVDNMEDEEDGDFLDEEGNETEISEEELEETAEDVVARLQAQSDAMGNLTEEQLTAALQQQAG